MKDIFELTDEGSKALANQDINRLVEILLEMQEALKREEKWDRRIRESAERLEERVKKGNSFIKIL